VYTIIKKERAVKEIVQTVEAAKQNLSEECIQEYDSRSTI
jgi:hypothetical protein